MSTGHRILTERVFFAVLAVIAATVLWWSVSGARPADKVLSPHEGIACAGCHMQTGAAPAGASRLTRATGGLEAAVGLKAVTGPTAADQRCAECHARLDRGSTLAAVFHGPQGAACSTCHSFHNPTRLTAGTARFVYDYKNPALRAQCTSCHRKGSRLDKVTDGHRDAAAAVYHVDAAELAGLSSSEPCLRCHSHRGGASNLPASAAAAPRFHEEATHTLGEPLPLGFATGGYSIRRKVDARIVLVDGRIECQTCHALADDVEDLLVRFETKYDLCLGCHLRHPAGGNPLAAGPGGLTAQTTAALNQPAPARTTALD
jgi:predicted CXXCH cytochrome family protein